MFRLFRFLDRNRPSRKPRTKPPPKIRRVRPILEILEDRIAPATFTVTSTGDTGAGAGNKGDLRYCIVQLNNSTDPNNSILFNVTGTITLNSALPVIQKPVTISGPGSTQLAVSGNGVANVFKVWGVTAAINSLEIE
jgi:hypothetical protein